MNTSSKKLSGKVAVVTGASKGIGAAIAKHLAAEGASVVVNYASSKTGADKIVAEITSAGGKAVAIQADVAKKADIERLFVETKKAFGRLDILVNNAGIYEFSPLEGITEEHFHKQFNLNVLGLILVSQAALNLFDSAGGSIINTSSVASTLGFPNAWMPSPARSRRNSARAGFASTPFDQAWWRRRERTRLALRGATCKRRSKHRHRLAAPGSRRTSPARRLFWHRLTHHGSPAKPSSSPEATAD